MDKYGYMAIPRALYYKLRESVSTQAVLLDDWPPFVKRMVAERGQAIRQVWGWASDRTEAVIEVVREYLEPVGTTGWKWDRWYLVERADAGSANTVLIVGPDRDIETTGPESDPSYGHHGNALPGWPLRGDQ